MGIQDGTSIVIPILNEEDYIEKCLNSVINQDYPKENLELILVDGMSNDSTVSIIEKYMKKYKFILLLKNPNRTVQYALNIGVRAASGKYIVRMDAHSEYAPDYVSKCIENLEKTGAANVGGPTVAKGINPVQTIIAAAYESPFALGASRHYDKNFQGFVDTVSWGAFRKSDLIKIGLYDERLTRNEDDDLNFRLTQNGLKVFITPEIKSIYYPRSTFKDLFKQYFQYGLWKVAIVKKHKKPARIAHLVPMAFVAFILLFTILSFFSELAFYSLLSVLALYLLIDMFFSFKSSSTKTFFDKLMLMFAHAVIHISYGLGFWIGIFKFWNVRW